MEIKNALLLEVSRGSWKRGGVRREGGIKACAERSQSRRWRSGLGVGGRVVEESWLRRSVSLRESLELGARSRWRVRASRRRHELKAPVVPRGAAQSCVGRGEGAREIAEQRHGPTGHAPWLRNLSGSLSTSRTRPRSSARHNRLGRAPARVSSEMPGLSTGYRLQAPDFRAARHFSSTNSLPQQPTLRSARAYIPPRALPLPSFSSRGKLPEGGRFPR